MIVKYYYYHDVLAFKVSVKDSMISVENQICCMLRLHKRLIEKVITLPFPRSLDKLDNEEKTKRVRHIKKCRKLINMLALGTGIKPCHWKCTIKNGQKVGDSSFIDGQAKKVDDELPNIIAAAPLLDMSKAGDWLEVTEMMSDILITLR
jgi:hypothetical protein